MKSFCGGRVVVVVVVGETIYKGRNRGASSTKYGSIGIKTGEAKGPEPQVDPGIELRPLDKTFLALPILTFTTATLFATATGRTSLSFPQLHIHHTRLKPLVFVEK